MLAICALALAAGAACDDGGAGDVPADASAQPDGRAHVTTTIFLNFDGARLKNGYPSDARTNTTVYVRRPGVTVPPWRDGRPERAASVAAITERVRRVLAPYDIDIVTTRPLAGSYDMIMFGGQPADLFGAGTMDLVSDNHCGAPSIISFVTEAATDDDVAASLTVAAIGSAHHIPETTAHGDCLCYQYDECRPLAGLCTIGGAGTPTRGHPPFCDDPEPPPTIDEHAYFLATFGAR